MTTTTAKLTRAAMRAAALFAVALATTISPAAATAVEGSRGWSGAALWYGDAGSMAATATVAGLGDPATTQSVRVSGVARNPCNSGYEWLDLKLVPGHSPVPGPVTPYGQDQYSNAVTFAAVGLAGSSCHGAALDYPVVVAGQILAFHSGDPSARCYERPNPGSWLSVNWGAPNSYFSGPSMAQVCRL